MLYEAAFLTTTFLLFSSPYMERKEFLALLGLSAGAVVVASCVGGCSKSDSTTANQSVDFTLDLSNASNAALTNNGGYLVKNGVIVARTSAGAYIAVASACTHEGTTIEYQSGSTRFHCPNHGANFSETGAVQNGPASTNLQQFKTTLSGTSLRVYS